MEAVYVLWMGGEPLLLSDTPKKGFVEEEVNNYFFDEVLCIDPSLDLVGYFFDEWALPEWGYPEWEGEGYYLRDRCCEDVVRFRYWRTAIEERLSDREWQFERVAYRLAHPIEWTLFLEARGWIGMDTVWSARHFFSEKGECDNPHRCLDEFYGVVGVVGLPGLVDPGKNFSLRLNHLRYFEG